MRYVVEVRTAAGGWLRTHNPTAAATAPTLT